jgi:hypothetical protein
MNEEMSMKSASGGAGEGAELPPTLKRDSNAQIAEDAEYLELALEAVALNDPMLAFEARKQATRLRFASERLTELKRQAIDAGGVFAPARAEVALSILEGHMAVSAAFVNRNMKRFRRRPGRRDAHAIADEATTMFEDKGPAERAA